MTLSLLRRIFVGVFFISLLASCSSTTIINSRPQGAKLYMDGSLKGQTPYSYSDTKIVGSSTSIKLSLDGYNDFNGVLTRSEQVDVGALIGGLFVLVPFLWIMDYNSDHTYELTESGMTSSTETNDRDSALQTKLQNLKKMHDDGTLTDEEYQSLRKKAIDNAK
jgi:hypothetical protein